MSQMITLDSSHYICEEGVSHPPFGLHLTKLFPSALFIYSFFCSSCLIYWRLFLPDPGHHLETFSFLIFWLFQKLLALASSRPADVGTDGRRPWSLPLDITSGAENTCLVQINPYCLFQQREFNIEIDVGGLTEQKRHTDSNRQPLREVAPPPRAAGTKERSREVQKPDLKRMGLLELGCR